VDLRRDDVTTHTTKLAANLAPPEEKADGIATASTASSVSAAAAQAEVEFAAIVIDSDDVNLSGDIVERPPEKTFLGMEPVVLVILGFMLAFIGFIAWQISTMPVE
jgi:hypothetical protein